MLSVVFNCKIVYIKVNNLFSKNEHFLTPCISEFKLFPISPKFVHIVVDSYVIMSVVGLINSGHPVYIF